MPETIRHIHKENNTDKGFNNHSQRTVTVDWAGPVEFYLRLITFAEKVTWRNVVHHCSTYRNIHTKTNCKMM